MNRVWGPPRCTCSLCLLVYGTRQGSSRSELMSDSQNRSTLHPTWRGTERPWGVEDASGRALAFGPA